MGGLTGQSEKDTPMYNPLVEWVMKIQATTAKNK